MEINKAESYNSKEIQVSLTGYRTLIILKSLMQKNCKMDELIQILKSNNLTNKSISKDTIRVSINTLKSAGCIINRPNKKNNYSYELVSHPFSLKLNDDEFNALMKLREVLLNTMNWEDMFIVNSLYEKIIGLTSNTNQIEINENSKPFKNINYKILKELSNKKLINRKVKISYISPEFGEELIDIIPRKIANEKSKLYLWCYNYKYKTHSLLNIERITKINNISIEKTLEETPLYNVIYEVSGYSADSFNKQDYEKILEQSSKSIKVKAEVKNEFIFIQRLLLLGNNFKILSPVTFREKMINKIKLIQKGYDDENT